MNRIAKEGLTFDDVLLIPAESHVLPNEAGYRVAPCDSYRSRGRHGHST